MSILYLTYWSIHDSLSQATVYPSIRRLSHMFPGWSIVVVSIERSSDIIADKIRPPELPNVEYIKFRSSKNGMFAKFFDFVAFPAALEKLTINRKFKFLLGRGSPAGALLYLVWRKLKINYYVESFEPHSEYMLESKVWAKWSVKYILQRHFEKKQIQTATGLMPVSKQYQELLIKKGFEARRIVTIPCVVDLKKFAFNDISRQAMRKNLFISGDSLVGIYVGKFGGIYFDLVDALKLFRDDFAEFGPGFHLLLLTDFKKENLQTSLRQTGLPENRVHIFFTPHDEVPQYLSASDFGYALIKPAPSKRFCSAIKIGEYIANGLTVVMPAHIGDDSEILREKNCASFIENNSYDRIQLFSQINNRTKIARIAEESRSPRLAEEAYHYLLKDLP